MRELRQELVPTRKFQLVQTVLKRNVASEGIDLWGRCGGTGVSFDPRGDGPSIRLDTGEGRGKA